MNGIATRTDLTAAALALLLLALPIVSSAQDAGCAKSASLLRYACAADLRDGFFTTSARCLDNTVPDAGCLDTAEKEYDDGAEECQAVLTARLELCEALDHAAHEPPFGAAFAANFVDPTEIGSTEAPNPYFPLVPGNRWVYEGATRSSPWRCSARPS